MTRFAFLSAVALLAAGCASRTAAPPTSVTAAHTQSARSAQHASEEIELRHYYLLSPGPNAKLVVTRSDVPSGNP
jgi:hypothetical protein